jgi:phosphoglycolate phosphatase
MYLRSGNPSLPPDAPHPASPSSRTQISNRNWIRLENAVTPAKSVQTQFLIATKTRFFRTKIDPQNASAKHKIELHSALRKVNRLPEPSTSNGRFSAVRVLIFDLDGTLIDSETDLVISVNATLEHMGRQPLPQDVVRGYIGRGAAALIRSSLGSLVTDEQAEEGHEFFLAYYRRHMLDHTVTYPGVLEALDALSSYKMAVLTNKPVRFSQAILDGLGIANHFQFVFGGNSFERKKPDPMGVELLLRNFSAQPTEGMMVGDSDVDVQTARNSGIYSCGVSYGLGFESMRDCPPDIMLDSLADLPTYLALSAKA